MHIVECAQLGIHADGGGAELVFNVSTLTPPSERYGRHTSAAATALEMA